MKIKLDENMPDDAAAILKGAGHDTSTVLVQGLGGKSDSEIAASCKKQNRVLITLDADFANLSAYPPEDYPGIIVFRLAHQAKLHILAVLTRLLEPLEKKSPNGHLWIDDESRLRIRPGDDLGSD